MTFVASDKTSAVQNLQTYQTSAVLAQISFS